MANKLEDMEFSSVDLCRRGANQRANIKLFKSADQGGGERGMIAKLADALQRLLDGSEPTGGESITKAMGTEQVRETTSALRKSLESIIADDSMSAVEKHDMMAESLQQFTLEATDLMDAWAHSGGLAKAEPPEDDPEDEEDYGEDYEEDPEDYEEEEETVEKGVFDMASIEINKMSPEDQAALEALAKKYGAWEEDQDSEIHPDVRKAIDEVAQLRKSLELKELEAVAKKYEIIGKKAPELAEKLYDLKKAGEQHYNDFVALLDEQVQMSKSGVFKEYGTSRGGAASDLTATVAEIMKAEPSLSRAQAIVKAYETNPALDPFTGAAK